MIPKKALLTGELLEWQKVNFKALLVMFEKQKDHNDYSFWGWMYERLERNQKHVKQSLKLGHFIPSKDGKPIGRHLEPLHTDTMPHRYYLDLYQQAKKEVLFDGWEIGYNERYCFDFLIYKRLLGSKRSQVIATSNHLTKEKLIKTLNRKWIFNIKTIEQLITQIPDIKITDNYYNETFKN